MHYHFDSLSEIKLQYITGNEVDGLEPKCGEVNVADGTANGIGHLFRATICHGGLGPGFVSPWVYKYITHGRQCFLQVHIIL